ncbi:MAG: hypothetical protein EXS64_19860 [Candidatus Latescibacteria bacterium]|nr:hypothetical protein [Candidatus Latescibacterota bacterium]
MTRVSILYWKEIPAQVKAEDEREEVSLQLPDRFQQGIDTVAMVDGSYGADAYLEAWEWGPEVEVPGSAREAAEALAHRIATRFPLDFANRLRALHESGQRDPVPGAIDHWMDE